MWKDNRGFLQPVIHQRRQFLHLFVILLREISAVVWVILQVVELKAIRSGDQLVPAIDDNPCDEIAIEIP